MIAVDWSDDAFFDTPERESVDGGTTSAGTLWHGVSVRWGHSMQTMCSYHGMFPAKVAHYFIQRYSRPGDVVLDPFSGRGTVPLQARVEGRVAVCNDLNPLAYVLSRAKVNPPSWDSVQEFLNGLEKGYRRSRAGEHHARVVSERRHLAIPEHQHAEHVQHVADVRREVHPRQPTRPAGPGR